MHNIADANDVIRALIVAHDKGAGWREINCVAEQHTIGKFDPHRAAKGCAARTLLALGASLSQQRRILAANLAFEMLPSLQKLSVSLFGILLFVEPIFGVPGVGTTAMRAIRRSDADLLLGVVVIFALLTASIGLAGQLARNRLRRLR